MTATRRRIIRPARASASPERLLRVEKLRTRLARERETQARWLARLRRAFHAVEKADRCIRRVEQQIARLEESPHG